MQHRKKSFLFSIKLLSPFVLAFLPFFILSFALASGRQQAQETVSASNTPKTEVKLLDRSIPAADSNRTFAGASLSYDAFVLKSLKNMTLSTSHIELWIEEHPDSALRHLKFFPSAMQRDIASTALFIRSCNRGIDEKTAWREAAAIIHYSAKYGIPPTFTTAVAHAESTFNPGAVSSKGAAGVMQVMWRIHNGLLESNGIVGKDSLADPEKGIAAGCLLLSRYIKAYGSLQAAMNRYYGGYSAGYQRKINNNMIRIATYHSSVF